MALFLVLGLPIGDPSLEARVITREEALSMSFPGATFESSIIFLTKEEEQEIAKQSGSPAPSAMVARYLARAGGKIVGRAYLDTHIVRTKKESLLVILDADGKVKRIETVAFLEPPEYIPPDRWYQQFQGQALDDGLRLGRDIHPVTGATLTARATTDAARRALATDQILLRREGRGKKP
ncbi:MAG: FMN-binding protein [Acidobacteria bacterium]|nr:FMN-binding protein [Acidobacteriota bacterium]